LLAMSISIEDATYLDVAWPFDNME
jgi:hypothetical protein